VLEHHLFRLVIAPSPLLSVASTRFRIGDAVTHSSFRVVDATQDVSMRLRT
jgi:hypothetical protein